MRFVDDDQIPVATQQALFGILDARDPRHRGDDLVAILPRVRAVVGAQHVAANDLEVLAEFVFHFALPLKRQIGRGDDQRAFDQPANFEFFDQQPGHDGFARARIVGQQEADARQLEEVVIDGFKLMRQRIDPRDGQAEVGVVLVSQAQPRRLDAQSEAGGVPVERLSLWRHLQRGDLIQRQNRLMHLTGA